MKSTVVMCLVLFAACGPGPRRDPVGNENETPDASFNYGPEGSPETCADGFDNEGDGVADCADADCSGVGECPVCGDVDVPEAQPLALPDGVSGGTGCTMNSQCGGGTPNCILSPQLPDGGECHASYTSTLNFIGFPTNALLTDPAKLLKICVKIEHTWLRDIQIDMITPDNRTFILQKFRERLGGEIYLGDANDSDSASSPVPGTGWDYCWNPAGVYEMIDATTSNPAPTTTTATDGSIAIAPGDYKASSAWNELLNVPLNGAWTLRVSDLWGADNGYIFSWSIQFDPSLIVDCSGPIIL